MAVQIGSSSRKSNRILRRSFYTIPHRAVHKYVVATIKNRDGKEMDYLKLF
ncbi:predicted protein [Sclerotinia sclerotiorum 1980 UF-70]|uniref:Uncharacterized protein n=1 Tax=Sclerotinia sclerotiorum (strain ATCC 18683 / 1980 / Ss-1) TaxID=665079 RepID=A7ET82_SCLS1|nr:predicted protein [Sclerotinia sclerotiorum 1980 UF-70]EDN92674.1 predicted protein [Sclerotinia sclerotiorum 1980 UF-70]